MDKISQKFIRINIRLEFHLPTSSYSIILLFAYPKFQIPIQLCPSIHCYHVESFIILIQWKLCLVLYRNLIMKLLTCITIWISQKGSWSVFIIINFSICSIWTWVSLENETFYFNSHVFTYEDLLDTSANCQQ